LTAESPFTLPGFFAALSEGELLAGRCEECDKRLVPPRPACYECGSRNIEIEPQPRTGEVLTYTEVYRPPPPFAHLAPITIGTVELDSGARLTGRIEAPYDDVNIGMSVRMVVRQAEDLSTETSLRQEQDWPLHLFEVDS
jgi:uncharacterized OB-fold protein